MVIPGKVLGKDGGVAPSNRIVMGCIGIRGRGFHDLRWLIGNKDAQVVSICDVQRVQRHEVKKFVDETYGNEDCKMYSDMRVFFAERDDVDAVLIATGDRWHAQASIRAMRAGMDVFTEKPSTMTVEEGQMVVETAERYGRVYQTGTQRLSEPNHVFAIEMARTGRLGKVSRAYAHIAPWDAAVMSHEWLPAVETPPKDVVDWDAWLGPCPWRPYHPDYVKGAWRGYYDFHTSCIGEWGAHTFAQALAGFGASDTKPVKYQYVDNDSGDGMVCTLATGQEIVLSRGDEYWYGSCGERFDGERGWVGAADGYAKPDASSPELLTEFNEVIGEYKASSGRSLDHMRNFLDCVKSRDEPVANQRVMHNSMCMVHAANICMWLKRDIEFDPETETFVNDEEANRLRSRAMREPWVI